MALKKSTRFICSVLIVVALLVPLVFLGSGFLSASTDKVLPGVVFMGVDLGNLNKAEGEAKIAELEKELRAKKVTLFYQERSWNLLLGEAGLNLNEEMVMEAAFRAGREGGIFQQMLERRQLKQNKLVLPIAVQFDQERLSRQTKEFTQDITVEPVEADLVINGNGSVSITSSQSGTGIDMDKLSDDLAVVIAEDKEPAVELSVISIAPARSTESVQAMGIDGLLAEYSTWFNSSISGRTENIRVAARAFDERLVAPGENVSFNEIVGPRSSEEGYKNAPVIINNEFVDGLGGGVCQVSTTIYNCVLLAGLEIVERSNHSLPVSYVPIGRDATVVYEQVDFVFRNNTASYIYIKSFVSSGQLGFRIYGNTAGKKNVQVNSWVTQEIAPQVFYEEDPNLPEGEEVVKQEGAKGFRASAERLFLSNGTVEKREPLSSSYYSPVNRIVTVGTMKLPAISVPETDESIKTETQNNDRLENIPSSSDMIIDDEERNNRESSSDDENIDETVDGNDSGERQSVNQVFPGAKPFIIEEDETE